MDTFYLLAKYNMITIENISDAITDLGIEDAYIIPSIITKIKSANNNVCITYSGKPYITIMADINDPRPSIFKNTRDYLDNVPKNNIVIVSLDSYSKLYSTWGELLCDYANKREIKCTITTGCIRDYDEIKNHSYPVFYSDGYITPIRGNGKYKVVDVQKSINFYGYNISPDDTIFVSNSGIAIIPDKHVDKINERVFEIIKKEEQIKKFISYGLTLEEINNKIF